MKINARRIFSNIPLAVYQRMVRREVIGLFYHLVSAEPVAHVRHLYPHRPTTAFEQDLVAIHRHFHPVSYADLLGSRAGKNRLPGNAVILSFDDGFAECFTVVRPLLLKYGIPCIFFLATDFVDNRKMYYRNQVSLYIDHVMALHPAMLDQALGRINRCCGCNLTTLAGFLDWSKALTDEETIARVGECIGVDITGYLQRVQPYLTSEQIRTLAADGFTIGAHSRRHQKLNRLEVDEAAAEIIGSCQVIRELSGEDQVPFSFPNSAAGLDRRFLADVRDNNSHVGLLFDTRGFHRDREFMINRIWVEAPSINPGGTAPFMQLIRQAYQNYVIEQILRLRKGKQT